MSAEDGARAIGEALLALVDEIHEFRDAHIHDQGHEGAARKVLHEAQELARNPWDGREACDVLVTLLGWCEVDQRPVAELIQDTREKVAELMTRTWVRQDDGTWQHRTPV